ncbi:unnamed protein product, partial [Aphanomyces euteiches]
CYFNGCNNAAAAGSFKCLFHIHRSRCLIEGCRSQVYARNLCVRHGGKRQCAFEGCKLNSRVGLYCTKHSPSHILRLCSLEGCDNQAHLRGLCFRHGGGRVCKVEGCETFARNRGLCARHTPKAEKKTMTKTTIKPSCPPLDLDTTTTAAPKLDETMLDWLLSGFFAEMGEIDLIKCEPSPPMVCVQEVSTWQL